MTALKALIRRHVTLVTIFVVALSLRAYHLSQYPRHNQTADEYAWTWAGMTLLSKKVPRSWSWLPPYTDTEMKTWRGSGYRMVTPWLDHPPLFALTMGAWMRSFGYRDPFWVDLWMMRVASLVLFTATFWLLAAVLSRLSDRRMMLLTLAVFAVCPLPVFNERLVVAENLFLPIALAMFLALLVEQRRPALTLSLLALGSIALPLTKVAAVAMSAFLVLMAWIHKRRSAAVVIALGTLVGVALFEAYGRYYDTQLFGMVVDAQRNRFAGFDAFGTLLLDPKVVEDNVPYLLSLLGLAMLVADAQSDETLPWLLMVLVYAGFIGFFADSSMVRGWYAIPIWPALAYGLARQIVNMWTETGARSKWLWIAFATPSLCSRLLAEHNDRLANLRWGYLAMLALAATLFLTLPRAPRRVGQAATVGLVGVQLLSDVALILSR